MKQITPHLSNTSSIVLICLATINPAPAQIIPDQTLPVNSRLTPGCLVCTIEGGTIRGVNLFHSFQEFSLPTAGEAFFNNALNIQNIFSRVTGSQISDIDGIIRTNGTANLFLINPNGIIFGPNARLDISGSFLASTAPSLKFPDGSEFSATNPQAPPLLTINITPGLQYGTDHPSISNLSAANNNTIINFGNLSVPRNLTLAADHLDLQGQLQAGENLTLQANNTVKIRDTITHPLIVSAGNQLLITGNQKVDILALNHPESGLFSGGDMVLRSLNPVGGDAHYSVGRNFQIEQLDGSWGDLDSAKDPIILAQGNVSLGNYTGASLHILAGGSVTLGNVEINSTDLAENTINPNHPDPFLASLANVELADGTTITINGAQKPTLDIRAGIDWSKITGAIPGNRIIGTVPPPNFTGATSADITVNGNIRISQADGMVLLTNQYQGNGLAGNILTQRINTNSFDGNGGTITLSAAGNIFTQSLSSNSNRSNSGDIALTAGGNISITSTAQFSLSSGSINGNGGDIILKAGGNISTESLVSGLAAGNSGDIALTAGGDISTQTIISRSRFGNGGNIAFTAGGDISTHAAWSEAFSGIAGDVAFTAGGNITISSDNIFNVDDLGSIAAGGREKGGDIALTAGGNILVDRLAAYGNTGGDIALKAGGDISTALITSTANTGNAGDITLTAGSNISTGMLSSFSNSSNSGHGGDITLTAGSNISTESLYSYSQTGNGGNIALTATTGTINIYPNFFSFSPGEINSSGASGGNITITSPTGIFELTDGLIKSNGLNGNGGQIQINAESVFFSNTELTTTTQSQGNAGNISLIADNSISLEKSRLFTSLEPGGIGNGGNINIAASNVTLNNFSLIDTATFSQGDAGNVQITADDSLSLDNSAIFSITAGTGDGGDVTLKAGNMVSLTNASNINTAVNSTAKGNGGDITIATRYLSIIGGSQMVTNTSSSGKAGAINVNANQGIIISEIEPDFTISPSVNITATLPNTVDAQQVENQSLNEFLSLDIPDHTNPNVEFSTRIPYVSIANHNPNQDYFQDAYSFEVTTAGTRAIFDIDRFQPGGAGTYLTLVDSAGNELARNYNAAASLGAGGSTTDSDPYLRYVFTEPGTYFIQVNSFNTDSYNLQVSLETPNLTRSLANGILASGLFADADADGIAGTMTINTPQLTILNGGNISATATATASSMARGGNINLNASEINLSGNNSGLFAQTQGAANAGSLTIKPDNNGQDLSINFSDNAQISASTSGMGEGGRLIMSAPRAITLSGNGQLSVETSDAGAAGDVQINTRVLTIQEGMSVSASTSGSGYGGSLIVTARESVELIGTGGLFVQATNGGTAGNLSIDTGRMSIRDGAKVTVSSPLGQAGNLTIKANSLLLDRGQITAETGASGGEGGANISLQDLDVLLMSNESLISAQAFKNANGGNINIDSELIIVLPPEGANGSDIIANAESGDGGRIRITGKGIFGIQERPAINGNRTNDIDASSQFGNPGEVELSFGIDPSSGLIELPINIVDVTSLVKNDLCRAAIGSSFILTGRGGLPTPPNEPLNADAGWEDWRVDAETEPTEQRQSSQIRSANQLARDNQRKPQRIIEAQGWYRDGNGNVILTAQPTTVTPHDSWLSSANCQ